MFNEVDQGKDVLLHTQTWSHILSARMSSRPLGWCYEGADQMSKLRVYKANKGNVLDLFKEHEQEEKRVPIAKVIIKSETFPAVN